MAKFKIEDGDLELLAMGLLDHEREQAVWAVLENDEELNVEYLEIQDVFSLIANENTLEVPSQVYFKTKAAILEKKQASAIPFYKTNTFRIAASVLLVGSLLANFFLFKKELAQVISPEQKILAELPMSKTVLEEMLIFLRDGLEKEPCSGGYKLTKQIIAAHHLNEQEVIAFMHKYHGHCDCEVLMNVSMPAAKEPYIHIGGYRKLGLLRH